MWTLEKDDRGHYLRLPVSSADAIGITSALEPGEMDWMTKQAACEMAHQGNPEKFPFRPDQPYGNQNLAYRIRHAIRNNKIAERDDGLILRSDFVKWMRNARFAYTVEKDSDE